MVEVTVRLNAASSRLKGCCSGHLTNMSIMYVQDPIVFTAQPTLVAVVCEVPSH